MEDIHVTLQRWKESLPDTISVGGLLARCPIAYKWKAPFRVAVLRETLLWRMQDLSNQSVLLAERGHILGARILLRSAVETLALLVYLNEKMEAVTTRSIAFSAFDEITCQLLLGSKTGVSKYQPVNILTVLSHAEKHHKGIKDMYERLCESAHPNFDGVVMGYSSTNRKEYETTFGSQWAKLFGKEQEPATAFVMAVFEHEYNVVCLQRLQEFERWLCENDSELEASRTGS